MASTRDIYTDEPNEDEAREANRQRLAQLELDSIPRQARLKQVGIVPDTDPTSQSRIMLASGSLSGGSYAR